MGISKIINLKRMCAISLSSILVFGILFAAPYGTNLISLQPQEAHAITLTGVNYDMLLTWFQFCFPYTRGLDDQGIAGNTAYTLQFNIRQGTSSATEVDVLLQYTPLDANGNTQTAQIIPLVRDYPLPGDNNFDQLFLNFDLPSPGHTGFKLLIVDNDGGFSSLSYPHVGCGVV